ncbi:DUF3987 domain-containing protein [Phormidium tenue FACHB-886]|nr:DUF3987 domain-containing protein [Phormidium tenue FACHB-886]
MRRNSDYKAAEHFSKESDSSRSISRVEREKPNSGKDPLDSSSDSRLKQLEAQIQSTLRQDLSASATKAFKLQLRLDNPDLTAQDIQELWEAIAQEDDRAEEHANLVAGQLPTLMQAKQQRLVLADYLWGDKGRLAVQLTAIAEAMPTAPEFLLATLIPAAGSRIGAETQIVIKPSAGYVQPPIYRTLIVAPTGTKKTPAQSIVLSALEELDAEEFNRCQDAQAVYEKKLYQYEASLKRKENAGERPMLPLPRKRYILGDSTIEARERIHQENPRGFLIYRDEGSAHFTGRNKYRRGVGDDAEAELSEFNGSAFTRDRKSGGLVVPRSAISRTGSIQWETLASLMKSHDDNNGEWARWLFCVAPTPPAKIDLFAAGADTNPNVNAALKQLYQKVDSFPPAQYFLTDEAKVIFQAAQHCLIDWMKEENQPGLKAAYPKFESYLARLALWLHLINAALGYGHPALNIDQQVMIQATHLTTYFINQLRLIYAYNSPQQQLTGVLLRMQVFAENKGRPVELQEFKSGIWSLRKNTTAQIRENLSTLVQFGYGNWVNGKYDACSIAMQPGLPSLFEK